MGLGEERPQYRGVQKQVKPITMCLPGHKLELSLAPVSPPSTTPFGDPIRARAVDLLCKVDDGARVDDLLLAARLPDPRDRRFLRQLVSGVVKWRLRLDWIVDAFANRPIASLSPAIRQVLRLGVYQLLWLDRVPDRAAVHGAVELAKHFEHKGTANFVNAILRRVVATGRQIEYPDRDSDPDGFLSTFHSHPRWLVSRWRQRWGVEQTEDLLRANNEAPAVYIRAAQADAPPVAESFGAEQLEGHRDVWHVKQPDGLFADSAFERGWFVQDVNAGLAARLLAPDPGSRVLDACAAPGGKSVQLMSQSARVLASDVSAPRLRRVAELTGRLGLRLPMVAEDGRRPAASGPFDFILADVPCSGTGVLRRHPEARWHKSEQDLSRQATRQAEILRAAFARLRPGGVLVYSTCSLELEENDEIVDAFLASHKDAHLESAADHFPDRPWAQRMVQTVPGRDPGDGAYAARIRRLPAVSAA